MYEYNKPLHPVSVFGVLPDLQLTFALAIWNPDAVLITISFSEAAVLMAAESSRSLIVYVYFRPSAGKDSARLSSRVRTEISKSLVDWFFEDSKEERIEPPVSGYTGDLYFCRCHCY
jgi:hypothetical protein